MKVEVKARRTVSGEPLMIQTNEIMGDVASALTQDGRRFPAQATCGGVMVVADVQKNEPLELELSAEPINDGVQMKFADDRKALDVYIGGKRFTSYVFDRGFVKPYLGPVYTPDGNSYTRLDFETSEHPHQRSVFFAVGDVEGIDFWNEYEEERGEQHHQGFERIESGSARGSFTAKNVWTNHCGDPILDEKRTYTFYNQPENCRYVDAEVTFTAAYQEVHFGASKEAGPLGIRVNSEISGDQTGHICNAYGALGEDECWGRSAPWCDYTGTIDGKTYGITVFDNEDNERYPTAWHIRDYGLFAANNLYFKGGLKIPLRYSLTYKYRICFHDGAFNAADRFMVYAK